MCDVTSSGVASAQVPEVAIARQLAIQGIDAVESGDCAKGMPLLTRAEQMHHASVHLQYLARCRAADGRLVMATEMWRQIIREGAPNGASPAIIAAINEATTSLERTLPRLASTTIRTTDTYSGVALTLDGTSIPAEIVGTPQALDPGDHELRASAPGFLPWSHRWSVAEGAAAEVLVTLTAGQEAPREASEPVRGEPHSFPLATVGWVTASAGAASLVAATVTWLTRNSRRDQFRSDCHNEICPAGYGQSKIDDNVQTIKTLTTFSNVFLFGGGALLAGGVTMIAIGDSRTKEPHTALHVVGPNGCPGLTLEGNW